MRKSNKYSIVGSIFIALIFFFVSVSHSQNIFLTEDFNNGCFSNCLAGTYTSTNGSWTVTNIGSQGFSANTWYVSCAENGNGAGNCASGCGSNATLHLGAQFDGGASYNTWNGSNTNKRVNSPNISTIGKTNITINFVYMENGDGANDDGSVFYSTDGGNTWTLLVNNSKTTTCSPGVGKWASYSSVLPTSCENISNLKIGFLWINNADGVGINPSFAIDDVTLSTSGGLPPVANFTTGNTTICAGQCINFSDQSTNSPNSWNWSFAGATPSSSTQQNPTNICYNTPGIYNVMLTATNSFGNNVMTKNNYITILALPASPGNISGPTTVCFGQANVNYSISSVSGATSYVWTVPSGATISSGQGTTNIVVTFGNTSGNICVSASNSCGTSSTSCISVTVNNCPAPVASFSVNDTTICAGQCVNFNDLSSNGPSSWNWSFPGGNPSSSTQQNPTNICYSATGNYNVTLTVTSSNGSDTQTQTNFINVTTCAAPIADFSASDTTLCAGQCINYFDNSISAVSWSWAFPGATPSSSIAKSNQYLL